MPQANRIFSTRTFLHPAFRSPSAHTAGRRPATPHHRATKMRRAASVRGRSASKRAASLLSVCKMNMLLHIRLGQPDENLPSGRTTEYAVQKDNRATTHGKPNPRDSATVATLVGIGTKHSQDLCRNSLFFPRTFVDHPTRSQCDSLRRQGGHGGTTTVLTTLTQLPTAGTRRRTRSWVSLRHRPPISAARRYKRCGAPRSNSG